MVKDTTQRTVVPMQGQVQQSIESDSAVFLRNESRSCVASEKNNHL